MGARAFFDTLESKADAGKIAGVENSYLFIVEGEGSWLVDIRGGQVKVTEGWDGDADVTLRSSSEVFDRIVSGKQNPATAYMTGKIKLDGDLSAALKLQKIF